MSQPSEEEYRRFEEGLRHTSIRTLKNYLMRRYEQVRLGQSSSWDDRKQRIAEEIYAQKLDGDMWDVR